MSLTATNQNELTAAGSLLSGSYLGGFSLASGGEEMTSRNGRPAALPAGNGGRTCDGHVPTGCLTRRFSSTSSGGEERLGNTAYTKPSCLNVASRRFSSHILPEQWPPVATCGIAGSVCAERADSRRQYPGIRAGGRCPVSRERWNLDAPGRTGVTSPRLREGA